jgi:hypothetical protein
MSDKPSATSTEPAHILWTGGWDSTFRVLDLVLRKRRAVQSYYIIDPDRPSFGVEIRTRERIKDLLGRRDPALKDLLLPTRFRIIADICPDGEISDQLARLKAGSFIGGQYEWLARFAKESGIPGLELCIHKDDTAHKFLESLVVKEGEEGDSYYRLEEDPTRPDLGLFRYFRFPLFDLTKTDMQDIARRDGFGDLMEETWFCHTPLRGRRPCGTCPGCRYTIREGLARRLPFGSRLRFHADRYRRKLRRAGVRLFGDSAKS